MRNGRYQKEGEEGIERSERWRFEYHEIDIEVERSREDRGMGVGGWDEERKKEVGDQLSERGQM
jgi:hypothetical protein